MKTLQIPRDLLHTFSPTSVLTFPTVSGKIWWEAARTRLHPPMTFVPRTCVGSECMYHTLPKFNGTEECSCVDEGDVNQNLKDLLSRVHKTVDQEWTDHMADFMGLLDWPGGLEKAPEHFEWEMRREEEAFNWDILKTTHWVSELFSLLEDNNGLHFWPEPVPQNRSLLTHLQLMLAKVQRHKSYALESWKNNSPNHKLLDRLRNPQLGINGSLNPITGWPLRTGETLEDAVTEAWNVSCFKRAFTRTELALLEETESMVEDTILQEQLANSLKDLQTIVDTRMERDSPDAWEEHVFFQTSMATLVLQWELNFRKEALKMDLSHLISRLEKIQGILHDIENEGCPGKPLEDDEVYCCSALNTASGCRGDTPLTMTDQERLLKGIYYFTAQQQIALLQNGLRRTLILEEIFQRLSTQILHKLTNFPGLRNKELIPLDFNMDKFMARTVLEGDTVTRCRSILARLAGRVNQGCFGCTRACLTKDFARF